MNEQKNISETSDDSCAESNKKTEEEVKKRVRKLLYFINSVLGIVTFMVGIATWLLYVSDDPFLLYYFTVVVVGCVCFFLIIRYNQGSEQKKGVIMLFIAIAIFGTLAVYWRHLIIDQFLLAQSNINEPVGFRHKPFYLPYFLVLGAAMIVAVSSLFYYTNDDRNTKNRWPIFGYLIIFSVYMLICRIAWYLIDSRVWKSGIITSLPK